MAKVRLKAVGLAAWSVRKEARNWSGSCEDEGGGLELELAAVACGATANQQGGRYLNQHTRHTSNNL